MSAVPKPRPLLAPPPPELPSFDFRDGLVLCIPASAHTINGFREWVKSDDFLEKVRVTFISGEITLDMSKEEIETHNKVKTEVMWCWGSLDRDAEIGTLYTEDVLISHEGGRSLEQSGWRIYVTWESIDCRPRSDGGAQREGRPVSRNRRLAGLGDGSAER